MNAKRKTTGRKAPPRLAAILDERESAAESARPAPRSQRTPKTAERAEAGDQAPTKARATFYLPADLLDRLRNAADALSGPPTRATVNATVADALAREVSRLERKHNGGDPFPARPGSLRPGRKGGRG